MSHCQTSASATATVTMCVCVALSNNGLAALRLEEMEKMLKEAQQEKARLVESRVSTIKV